MMKRPAPLNRAMDGLPPAEKALLLQFLVITADWPTENRNVLRDDILAALDEAYQKGIDATIAANMSVPAAWGTDASPEIEALARAALVFDAGGGP